MKKSLILVFVLLSVIITAQTTIRGVVIDDIGPIADISIKVKGTKNGTVSNFDGEFSLKVNLGDVLVFSHVSYRSQEVLLQDYHKLNIVMLEKGGYYVRTVYKREKRVFITLDYLTDVNNKTNGFLVRTYLPKLFKKMKPQIIYSFQKGKNNTQKRTSEIRLAYLFNLFKKSFDLNLIYNNLDLDKFKLKKQLVEVQFGQRILRQSFDFYLGYGKVNFNNTDRNIYEVGVTKRFFDLFNLYSKTSFLDGDWQFQNGLNMYYKKINFQVEYAVLKPYEELDFAIGYSFKF